MSIDYDRLRDALIVIDSPKADKIARRNHTVSLRLRAPDTARELLRLRDEVEKLREMCLLERDAAFQETPMRAGEATAFNVCAEQLTDLLNGDIE